MSIFIRRLLPPRAPWILSIGGEVRTFGPSEHERASDLIEGRAAEVFAGYGKSGRIFFSRPKLDQTDGILAIGIRTSLAQKKALLNLQNAPGMAFTYDGSLIAIWRFEAPVKPSEADKTEAILAERFKGKRLHFWFPIPPNLAGEFSLRKIDPHDVASISPATAEDNEELSADCAPTQRAFALEPIAQRGAITLISGDAGMGKSQIALDMAMRVTRGVGLPEQPAPAIGGVLCCEEEDDWTADVVARLIANGANRKLIKGIRAQDLHTERGVNRLSDIKKRFEAEISLTVLMLILSPYMACFGGGSNQEVHMREKLKHIAAWSKRSSVAVLGVAHLDDSGGVAGPKTHRRLARASWKVIEDEDTGQRLFICDKANNTPDDFKLAYRIQGVTISGGIKTSKIVWEDVKISTQDTSSLRPPMGKTDKAESLIRDLLNSGENDSATIRKLVLAEGVSVGAFLDAKKRVFGDHGTRGKRVTLSL